ncbi:MAG: carbohydrate ABC transporter permease [Oscillospiraceae bacterium]|nr:carbohydrate ABC transporter permease [Oscillospiraceae bacterium]
MVENRSISRIFFNVFNVAFMILLCFVCVAPIWHVLMASVSDPRALMNARGLLWTPEGQMTFRGYQLVFKNNSILTGYINTLIYVGAITLVGTLLTMIAGFVLSRRTKLRTPLTIFVLFTMMFNGGLIPSFMVNLQLGIVNTRWAIILPGLMNAFYIIIMKSSFEQLPASFEESAKLDGAGPFTIMVRILAPLVKATIAVIMMFIIVMQWNSWFPASIYLQKSRELWPLQLYMREILVQNDTARILSGTDALRAADMTSNLVKYCVTIVGTIPILLVYPFAQKYFVKGVTLGGVKG